MTAHIGDEIVITGPKADPSTRTGEIRDIRDGPGGVSYLVRWSETGDESLWRLTPDTVIKHLHNGRTGLNIAVGDTVRFPPPPRLRPWSREHQIRDEALARHVHEVLVGCGLTHTFFSIGGGRDLHVPEILAIVLGPPLAVIIHLLPGQTPDEYTAHAPAIAVHLGMSRVHVVPLGPELIRLNLLP